MGREVKRVPLGFEWPINKVWEGFLNQHYKKSVECSECGGTGFSRDARLLQATCERCKGEGRIWDSKEDKAAYEAWEPSQPPAGDGWQIWETVSEGSPLSPVFATPEELAAHMAGTTWGADKGTPYETWLTFIRGPGWSVSMVMDEKGVRDGVTAAVDNEGG